MYAIRVWVLARGRNEHGQQAQRRSSESNVILIGGGTICLLLAFNFDFEYDTHHRPKLLPMVRWDGSEMTSMSQADSSASVAPINPRQRAHDKTLEFELPIEKTLRDHIG